MPGKFPNEVLDQNKIASLLSGKRVLDKIRFSEILAKASKSEGLSLEEAAFLLDVESIDDRLALTEAAIKVKESIYGPRIVLFAPLYVSSHCINDCLYCGFRTGSQTPRRRLTNEEIKGDVEAIIAMGHKRILMVCGEDPTIEPRDIATMMQVIYDTRLPKGSIRRVNVNVAPLDTEGFRIIKSAGIGTYQCFQETFHRETYFRMHGRGPKSDFDNRIHVFDRCIEAGIDDFGKGFLFGLYDHRFDMLALLQHIAFLEKNFGIGPHTISIPRLEPAEGANVFETTPWKVSDKDLIKATAILRLAVPYTGIILSTRESSAMRQKLLRVGVSQMSAGSITNPGGYSDESRAVSQFSVQDHSSLDRVIRKVCGEHFIPSFCTGCYRKGRTGSKFQKLAKGQHINEFCSLNAVATLQEFLEDFASPETKAVGEKSVEKFINGQNDGNLKTRMADWRARIKNGERDIPY